LKPDLSQAIVPDWVRFISQDADGCWWGYSVEPLENHRGWYENEVGQHIKLLQGAAQKNWRDSLFRFKNNV